MILMRIGMILDQHFPPDPRVENEARLLLQNDHKVFLFSFSRIFQKDRQNINGINVLHYKQRRLIYKLSALVHTVPFYNWIVSSKIKNFIEQVKPDVLHVHDMVIAEAAFRANRKFNLPVVLDLHENRPEIMRMYKHVNHFPGRVLINLDKWSRRQIELINKANHTIVVTEEAKQEIIKNRNSSTSSIVVVPNTVNKDNFYNYPLKREIMGQMEGYFNMLYVGDTSLRRGTDTAVKAVALLKDKIPNLLLTFVGESSQDKQLKTLVKELDITDHVNFEGWQDFSLFPSYIGTSDVCLSPLKRNLHHDTTYANKLFQYMAMGKPIVVSDCPAQAHIVKGEDCGLIHEAGNEEDLANCILRLFQNARMAELMGKRGKKAIQEIYHWKNTGQPLVRLYDNFALGRQDL